MTSSRREHLSHTFDPHRVSWRKPYGAVARARAQPQPAHDEVCLDGLFTYCVSVLCEHDTAIAALGEALALAERRRERGRRPADRELRRPWLYALTRWVCQRRLTEQRARGEESAVPRLVGPAAARRRRELQALAWPEAAGTTPEQREALELAVRHQLPAEEVAEVLGLELEATHALLSQAACEVERTRAALAVVESGCCPAVARLGGDHEVLLGTALHRELVRHVDECLVCRGTAESVMADAPWPGTAPAGGATLPVLTVPLPAVRAATVAVQRAGLPHMPRFDRRGFPVESKDRAARRARLRGRALSVVVVATVLAAPVLTVVSAPSEPAPLPQGFVSASRSADVGEAGQRGVSGDAQRGPSERERSGEWSSGPSSPAVDVRLRDLGTPTPTGGGPGAVAPSVLCPSVLRERQPGELAVDARPGRGGALVRLTASGDTTVTWSVGVAASWLRLSRAQGSLRPGESTTVRVRLLRHREPRGAWSARLRVAPMGSLVMMRGRGDTP